MQQPSLEQVILTKMDHFLQLNKKNTDQKEVDAHSAELTAHTKNPNFINTAHRLLTTPNALGSDPKNKEILLTSLLKDKFKYEYETIASNIETHYNQLIEIAKALQLAFYATYTNISLALSYLYIHLLARQQASIETYLAPLIPSDASHIKLYNYYFKTLEYIATEIDNTKFVIDDIQRDSAHQKLISMQLSILQGLETIANSAFQSSQMSKENILYCFEAWITVHNNPEVLNHLPNHSLFNKVMNNIEDEDCGEAASNCLRSIIFQLKTQAQNGQMYSLLQTCSIEIVKLIDRNLNGVELEKAEDLVRIVCDYVRKSRKIIISKYDRNKEEILQKLITYLGDDLMNTYQTVADVFESLIKEMKDVTKQGGTLNERLYLLFDPLYDSLVHKCSMPVRMIKELNHTDQSKAHHISSMAQEIMRNRDFTEIIFEMMSEFQGKTTYLHSVVRKMIALVPTDQRNFYPKLEVYLFSLKDAAENFPDIDAEVALILKMYVQLAESSEPIPICVRRSFLNVFKSLTTSKVKNNEFMYRVMCLAVPQFSQKLVLQIAEKTFEKACEEYKHMAAQIFKEFGPVLEKFPHRSYLVRGLFSLICNNEALISQYLLQVLTYLFGKFQNEPDKAKRKEFMQSIIQSLKAFKESPLAEANMGVLAQFLRQNWTFIKQVLSSPQRIKDDEDSDVQKIVRILKVTMRTMQFHFSEFLEDLFTTVLSAFSQYPICSYVYLVEVTVTIFSAKPEYNDFLRRIHSDFCDIAFNHMNKIADISRFSYLLDDYMGMNKRFFLYNASIVLSSGKLPSIIELTINVFMGSDVPRIAKSAYSFFQTIFMVYWPYEHLKHRNSKEDITPFNPKPEDAQNYEALKQFLLQKLEKIVTKMLEHLSRAPTEQTRDYILDALVSQIKAFIPENPRVWGALLNQISSQILVQGQKQRMIEMLKSLETANFQSSRKIVKLIDRMLVLMNRRMSNANNRKNIQI